MSVTLLVTPEELEADDVSVEGAAYRHLIRARRLAVGDRVRVVDGAGRARGSEIVSVGRNAARLQLGAAAHANEARLKVVLLVAAPRPERAAWLVEKVTEVGAAAVYFFNSERAPRSYGESTLGRLRRVAAAALEQCHRSCLPDIGGMYEWERLEGLLDGTRERRYLDPRAEPFWPQTPAAGPVALVVGPEGGWSDAERTRLEALGCRPQGLGQRVLRVETAAVVATALTLLPSERQLRR